MPWQSDVVYWFGRALCLITGGHSWDRTQEGALQNIYECCRKCESMRMIRA